MAPKTSSFLQKQKAVVTALIVVVITIIGYFTYLALQDAPLLGEFVEGEHYFDLENPRRVRGEKIEVMEFFSYACPHCYAFEPELDRWAQARQEQVRFIRTPAISSDYWRLLGRNYYTLEHLGVIDDEHLAMFREIHDLKRQFLSRELLTRYYGERGIPEAEYLAAFNSKEVERQMDIADQMGRRLQVASVPAIVVHGRYLVRVSRSVGPSRMLDVVEHLIEKITTERAAGADNEST